MHSLHHWHIVCVSGSMKKKMLLISMLSATLIAIPSSLFADDDVKVDVKAKGNEKLSEANRKTHEKICQGNHGTITAKTDTSVTIDGTQYAMTADTKVNKQEEPLLLKTAKVGDHVCFTTEKAADGSKQIAQIIQVPQDTDKVRVREKDDNKIEVETPNKKIEVK